jgi:molybdopterin molybdotransferase
VYREKLLLCLSGNPFACFTAFELLARPVLAALSSRTDLNTPRTRVLLKNSFSKKSGQRRFIRARMEGGEARLPEKNDSGQLYSLLGCNCLLDIPAGTGVLEARSDAEALVFNMDVAKTQQFCSYLRTPHLPIILLQILTFLHIQENG